MNQHQEIEFLSECAKALVEHVKATQGGSASVEAGPVNCPDGSVKLMVKFARANNDELNTFNVVVGSQGLGYLGWAPGRDIDKERLLAHVSALAAASVKGFSDSLVESLKTVPVEAPKLVLVGR